MVSSIIYIHLALGFILASAIAFVALRRGSLAPSGAAGAVLLGTVIFGLGGWQWGVLLVLFFASSSALSHFKETRKAQLAEKFSKGSQRDIWQTLANGGAGAVCVLGNFIWPHSAWWAAYAGAIATVNADTWATELGVLSHSAPRLITTGRTVEVGTSGGVTLAGTGAATAGAALIALCAALFPPFPSFPFFPVLALLTLAGLLGSLIDSLMGATIQAIYYCENCQKETERHPTHTCGQPTHYTRGWRWLENDWVNFISSVAGSLLAVIGYWLFSL